MYVYVMYNKNNDVLYVGKTVDIETRVKQHFNRNREDWKNEVASIKYMDCYTEVDMSIYEIYLINVLKPRYNASMLYKGETLIELRYELKDYNLDTGVSCYDITNEEKCKIRQHLIIYEDNGKSKMNSNYDDLYNIKHRNNTVSSRWCCSNEGKYQKIIKNAYQYYKTIHSRDKAIKTSNLYISMWSNHIDFSKDYIKKAKKCINNFNPNINTKVICYLRNDYISKGNNKRYIDDKKSIMRLVNILRNSAIQNGENVYAYIPSSRMRDLLNKYLNDEL